MRNNSYTFPIIYRFKLKLINCDNCIMRIGTYLCFSYLGTSFSFLPIPDRDIVIRGLVDRTQVISTVCLREREATNRTIEFAVTNHAKSCQTDWIPYPYMWLRKILRLNPKIYTYVISIYQRGEWKIIISTKIRK